MQRPAALILGVAALTWDLQRQNLGLTGDWPNWDVEELHRLQLEAPEAAPFVREQLIPNKRHEQLGKAFQNYRRTTLNRLEHARKVARLLKL